MLTKSNKQQPFKLPAMLISFFPHEFLSAQTGDMQKYAFRLDETPSPKKSQNIQKIVSTNTKNTADLHNLTKNANSNHHRLTMNQPPHPRALGKTIEEGFRLRVVTIF
jgi:hypothetical protein